MFEIGNTIYYARAIPTVDIYEVIELSIRSSGEDWAIGVDSSTRQAFPFNKSDVGTLIFSHRADAEEVVKTARAKFGVRKLTKMKEEENGQ